MANENLKQMIDHNKKPWFLRDFIGGGILIPSQFFIKVKLQTIRIPRLKDSQEEISRSKSWYIEKKNKDNSEKNKKCIE